MHISSRRVRGGVAVVTLATASAILLAGCSGGGGGDASGSSDEFTLAYPLNTDAADFFKVVAEDYMKDHPDITITLNAIPSDQYGVTLRTQLSGGAAADVFYVAPGSGQDASVLPLAEADLLLPLDDAAAATVPEQFTSYFSLDGDQYAQPVDQVAAGMIWSGGTATALNATVPTDYDDMLAECTTLSSGDSGNALFVMAGAEPPNTSLVAQVIATSFVYAETPDWNEQRAAGDVTFADDEGWQNTLQAILDMRDAGCFQAGVDGAGFDAIDANFIGQKVPGMFAPGGFAAQLESGTPALTPTTVNPFPAVDGDQTGILSPTNALAVNAKTQAKTAVNDFLDYLASSDGSAAFAAASGNIPILATSGELDEHYAPLGDLLAESNYVAYPNLGWPTAEVNNALATGVQGLLTGQADIPTVLQSMDDAWGD